MPVINNYPSYRMVGYGIMFFVCVGLLLISSGLVLGQESGSLEVSQAAVATGVENRTPMGVSESFSPDVGMVFAFTRISGVKEDSHIKHLWFYGEKLMAEIKLPVKPPSWRTYSSKRILPGWTGPWRVEVTDQNGKVLSTLRFTVE